MNYTKSLSLCIVVFFAVTNLAHAAEAPVVDLSQPESANYHESSLSPQQRMAKLERQVSNLAEMNVSAKLEQLQQDLARLRGQLEVQTHDLELLKQQQQNFYQDLDQRLNKINSTKSVAESDTNSNEMKEQQAYETAFNLLNRKQYDQATTAFQTFIKDYPESEHVANAHYWLGEIYYLKGKSEPANKEFQIIVTKYPKSQKMPDAMLKIAMITLDKGNLQKAKQELIQIQKQFPGTTAAKLASMRLQEFKK